MSDIETYDTGTELEVFQTTPEAVRRMLETIKDDAVADPQAVSLDIVERILKAKNVREALTPPQTVAARDVLERPLVITGVHWNESDFTEGFSAYAVLEATDPKTEEELVVTCGGRNVMAQLYMISQFEGFPVRARFGESGRQTARGYRPLWLHYEPGSFTEADETAS